MINLNRSNIKTICIVILSFIIAVLIGVQSCSSYKIKQQKINISALTDSVTVIKDKYGNEVYSKNILLADYNDLKKLNQELADEVKKGNKKNLAEINKLKMVVSILQDSLNNLDGKLIEKDSNTYVYEFIDSTQYNVFKSKVTVTSSNQPDSILLNRIKDEVYADLIIKKYITDDKITLSVYSNNPMLSFTNIDGSIIDISQYKKLEKKKRFTFGVGISTGVGYTYGLTSKKSDLGTYLGVGLTLQYNIISF